MARILLVDDLPVVLEIISKLLQKLKHEVRSAQDSHQAMALLATEPFDLALIDLRLRGLSGIEVARQVRAAHPAMPMVMMSAHVDLVSPAALDVLWGLGIDHILTKPVGLGELETAVNGALLKARRAPGPA
jgi:CheY-like chemotaxis protein